MNSRKFSIIIIVGVLLLLLFFEIAAWVIPEEKLFHNSQIRYQRDIIYHMQHTDNDILLLGDSRMKCGVNPQKLGDNVYNMALSGSTPLETYYALKHYLEINPKPKMVLIGFAAEHYFGSVFFKKAALFSQYFTDDELIELKENFNESKEEDISQEIFMNRYRLPSIYMKPVINAISNKYEVEDGEEYDNLKNNRGFNTSTGEQLDDNNLPVEARYEHFIVDPIQCVYIKKLLKLCSDNNIETYLLWLPMRKKPIELIQQTGYLAEYKTFLKTLNDEYDVNVEVEPIVLENKYFVDSSHLNINGATIYSELLKNKLHIK